MATWSFILTIGSTPTDITSLVDIRSIRRDRALFNELRPRTGKVEFRCVFSASVYAQLIAADTVDLAITKDGVAYFTGCLSPNYRGQLRNGQKYLDLIVEDWGLQRLGKTIAAPIAYPGHTVCNGAAPGSSLVHVIAAAAGVTPAAGLPTISAVVPHVNALPEDKKTYAKLLEDILFDYGYVYYFLENGTLSIKESINTGTVTTTGTLTTAAGSQNILGALVPEKSPEKYDDIRVKYNLVELKNGVTVFQDTSAGDALHSCLIPLAAAGDADGKDYYPQTAKVGEVFSSWKSPDGYQIWVVASPTLVETHESGISISRALTNYYKKCSFAFQNTAAAIRNITKLKITGNAYVIVSQNVARLSIVSGKNLLEHAANYLFSDANAQNLARLLAQYYRYSDLKYTAKSKTAFSLGQYVLVSDLVYLGIAAKCRVIGIVDRESMPGVYEYELEAVADYTTTATTIEGQSNPRDDQGNNDESSSAMRESWYNNTPPTNNVTGLAFTDEDNSDGSVNVNVAWNYTQGAIPAIGFLVFYKSGTAAPDEIVLASDPSAFIAASETATAYSHTLAALSARFGGAGAVTRHYRFAVVAVSSCIGGMIPHNDGVVELAGWIDKTFAPTIDSSEGGATLSIEGQSLVWRNSTTGVELARIRNDVALSMLKASNLAALIRYRGSWVVGSWGSPAGVDTVTSRYPVTKMFADGSMLCIYCDQTTGYIRQKLRSAAGVWGAYSVIEERSSSYLCLVSFADGSLLLTFTDNTDSYRMREKICATDGTWGASTPALAEGMYPKSAVVLADDSVLLTFVSNTTEYHLRQAIRSPAGVWGASTIIDSTDYISYMSLLILSDGRILCVLAIGNAIYEKIRSAAGTWGSAVLVASSEQIMYPNLLQLPDGSVMLGYIYYTGYALRSRIRSTAGSWGAASAIGGATGILGISLNVLPNGKLICVYTRNSDNYLAEAIDTSAFSAIPIKDDYALVGAGIEEIGQNSNGTYIKFSEGTQVCFGISSNLTNGSGLTITLPAEFLNANFSVIGTRVSDASTSSANSSTIYAYAKTSTTFSLHSGGSDNIPVYWLAIGRWE